MTPERPQGLDASSRLIEPLPGSRRTRMRTPQLRSSALYAALDLGTNACRMLIAKPAGARFVVTDSFSKTVHLGAGLEHSGRLSPSSMQRTIRALRICQRKLAKHGVHRMRLVATEACRRAHNGRLFLNNIEHETGLLLEIIAPEEEARLAVISCASLVSTRARQLLIVDIGGGSTELVWIDLSDVPPCERPQAIMALRMCPREAAANRGVRVVDWISIKLGVATLNEQFTDVRDDVARFALMSWYFEEQLAAFAPYDFQPSPDEFQIIGTSGTVTTIAASWLGLRRYDRARVDGLCMTSRQIDSVIRSYLALGPEGRRCDPRIGRHRQAFIMSGAAIMQALTRVWPANRISVADRGLREGMLYSLMNADGVLRRRADDD